jgi:hypothetical protein
MNRSGGCDNFGGYQNKSELLKRREDVPRSRTPLLEAAVKQTSAAASSSGRLNLSVQIFQDLKGEKRPAAASRDA